MTSSWHLAKAEVRGEPLIVQRRAKVAWFLRWRVLLACSAAKAFALSLLEARPGRLLVMRGMCPAGSLWVMDVFSVRFQSERTGEGTQKRKWWRGERRGKEQRNRGQGKEERETKGNTRGERIKNEEERSEQRSEKRGKMMEKRGGREVGHDGRVVCSTPKHWNPLGWQLATEQL